MEELIYTRDLSIIDRDPYHLVLDVGPINKDVPVYGTAFTVEKMSMWVTDGLAIPVRIDGATRTRITGSLYRLSKEDLISLDKRKQNGLWFDRERIPVWFKPDHQLYVWFYVGRTDYWAPRLLWDRGFVEEKRTYRPAPRFHDNNRLFHMASAYDEVRVEHYDPPLRRAEPSPELIQIMKADVRAKNNAEIARLQPPWYRRLLRV